jgi:predicted dehydrogenase
VKWLIAGLGSIGRRHLRNLLALREQEIILYRTHQSTLPDDELSAFAVETDLAAALAHRPDAVIVANPTALHLDVAIPAARAGCHLLLEKPIAGQMDERVDELRKVVDEGGIKTLVGFQYRFHPVLMDIEQLLSSGRLGRVFSMRVHWGEYLPGWHTWEDYRQSYAARKDLGGGVVNTLCHPLDYVRWLFGEVSSLSAVTDHISDLELNVEDVAEITLNFRDRVIGSIHLDYFQRPPAHWMEIVTEKGIIRWDNATGAAQIHLSEGNRIETIHPPVGFERNQLFLNEMQHFIQVVKGETISRCDLFDGIHALALTEAVHQSSQTGCKVEF